MSVVLTKPNSPGYKIQGSKPLLRKKRVIRLQLATKLPTGSRRFSATRRLLQALPWRLTQLHEGISWIFIACILFQSPDPEKACCEIGSFIGEKTFEMKLRGSFYCEVVKSEVT